MEGKEPKREPETQERVVISEATGSELFGVGYQRGVSDVLSAVKWAVIFFMLLAAIQLLRGKE